MAVVKTLWTFTLFGAIVGAIVASFIAPSFISWYHTPGTTQAMCSCSEIARATTESVVQAQLIGAAIGAGVSFIAGIFYARARSKKQKAKSNVVMQPQP